MAAMRKVIFYLVAVAVYEGAMPSCPTRTNITVDGYRYWRVDDNRNFDGAEDGCTNGADLVIIRSNKSSGGVDTIISGCNDNFFIGLQYIGTNWYWVDNNEALTNEQSRWQSGEGTNVDTSGCACVNSEGGLWIDEPCASFHPYVCQKDLLYISVIPQTWSFLNQTENIEVTVRSDDGAVNISVYRNHDNNMAINTTYNVNYSPYTYVVENVTVDDNGTYTFVATHRDGYARSASTILFVQDPAAIVKELPGEITSPVACGDRDIFCISKGIPTPATYWARDNILVSESKDGHGVHQTITDFTAVLHIDDAVSSDDGIYSCVAENLVRVSEGTQLIEKEITDFKETNLRVFGSPTIINAILISCTTVAEINVSWEPNNQTVGINHVIKVTENSAEGEVVMTLIVMTVNDGVVNTGITGLTPNVMNIITVTVCPDECIHSLNDSTTFFVEVPEPVSDADVTESGGSGETFCDVRWSFSDKRFEDDLLSFKVIESSTEVSLREPSTDREQSKRLVDVDVTGGYYYKAPTKPNRNYTFDVYVSNCAGNSTITRAAGECNVEVTGPNETPPLTVDDSANDTATTRTMLMPIPNEINGPISCLFVVVQPGEGQISTVDNLVTLQELSNTATISTSSPTDGKEYIAIAIPMYDVYLEQSYVVVLGENQETSCDVYQISKADTRADYAVRGYNWELQNNKKYRVYMVSTTPDGTSEIFFTQSNETEFTQGVIIPADTDPVWWIALASIGAALLVVFGGLMTYYTKTFNKTDRNKKSQDDPYETVDYANGKSSATSALTATTDLPSTPLSPTAVLVSNLPSTFRSFSENDGENFSAEFEDLKQKTELFDMSFAVGSSAGVKKKNRYKNVLPYDHSRVCLVGGNGSDIESYINASYINGFERPKKFIATQGPLHATVDDFWKMVMQEKSKVIAMATNLAENGKKKCECYWPDSSASQMYGNVTVFKVSERKIGGLMKREFKLSDRFGSHSVVQFQLLNWPDHGVPISTSTLLRFYKACIDAQGSSTEPIIVHCSAGAGRTGTVIAYDYLIRQALKESVVDIFECVLKMRSQRMDMVQNCDQYKFIYRLMAEFHIFKETDLDADTFYAKPSLNSPTSTDLQNQLKNLDVASAFPRIAADKVSFLLNVSVTWRPEDGDTIARFDAVRIETYEDTFHLIASAPPTKSTAETFWRLNLDNDVAFVVSISDPTMQSRDDVNECWPSEENIKREFGSLTVELAVAEEKRHFHIRDLFVRRDSSLQTKEIRQYKMLKWRPKVALNVIKDIKRSCERLLGSKIPRVLIHCRRGLGETGSFCALINLMARLETERRIDVLKTVKDLKDANTRLVEDLKQYKFCYDALKCYDPPRSKRSTGNMKNSQNNSAYENEPMTTTL